MHALYHLWQSQLKILCRQVVGNWTNKGRNVKRNNCEPVELELFAPSCQTLFRSDVTLTPPPVFLRFSHHFLPTSCVSLSNWSSVITALCCPTSSQHSFLLCRRMLHDLCDSMLVFTPSYLYSMMNPFACFLDLVCFLGFSFRFLYFFCLTGLSPFWYLDFCLS